MTMTLYNNRGYFNMRHTKRYIGLMVAAALMLQMILPGTGVYAKVSKPKLSTKTAKVEVSAKKKITVKNAKGFKMTVKSKNKRIASVSKKGKTAFIIKGVKAGKTKVTCILKKNKKKVTLKCNVKVTKKNNITPTVQPGNSESTVTPKPVSTLVPTSTPEPTIAPFPETDKFYDVPYGYADVKETVPKGKIEEITYTSQLTNKTHKALVQLPANYSQDEKYPVLYLIHGENDTENAWNDMSADQIINNAIAFKMAKEMIVVMPNVSGDNDEDIIKDFGTDLKPAIEAKYSVAQGRHNNAVAGYGLGGRIALCIGLSLPEQVAYTGAFAPTSGVLPYDGGDGYFNNASFCVQEEYKETSFIMIQKGNSDDIAGNAPETYQQVLADNGTECLYLQMDGVHDNELFKAGLYNFIRRLFKYGNEDESIVNGFVTKVPAELGIQATQRGSIEVIEYDTETYDPGRSVKIHKQANVYLPYNYDPDKQYNILYLMHGGGENADTWIKGDNIYGDYTHNQNMINLMFQKGYCEPCIIVNPTFYRPEGAPEPDSAFDLTILFKYELRNDLIPAVEAKYSTYAGGDVSEESLKASRMHRGFAGLSMGSNTTYQSAFYGNYDLFAWFAPYSGYFSTADGNDAEADKFNKVIEEGEANGMPLGYVYCGNGSDDFALPDQLEIMEKALIRSKKLVPGRNFDFVMIPGGIHDMNQWHIHLYNTLQIFFTKE